MRNVGLKRGTNLTDWFLMDGLPNAGVYVGVHGLVLVASWFRREEIIAGGRGKFQGPVIIMLHSSSITSVLSVLN
jgi:hypothetical protein